MNETEATASETVLESVSPAHTLRVRLPVLILQHPQEKTEERSTAPLILQNIQPSAIKIGLSWANLNTALKGTGLVPEGAPAINPKEWGILYLGKNRSKEGGDVKPPLLQFLSKSGKPIDFQESQELRKNLKGVVVLDGTWSQAKSLWWRNAWVLKLQHVVLNPTAPSLYRGLRKAPRRECLSTLESVAMLLKGIGESPEASELLLTSMKDFVKKASQPKPKESRQA